jgi:hypothetical protein
MSIMSTHWKNFAEKKLKSIRIQKIRRKNLNLWPALECLGMIVHWTMMTFAMFPFETTQGFVLSA